MKRLRVKTSDTDKIKEQVWMTENIRCEKKEKGTEQKKKEERKQFSCQKTVARDIQHPTPQKSADNDKNIKRTTREIKEDRTNKKIHSFLNIS